MQYVEQMGLLPVEQKALRKGARGCLLIDGAVAKEAVLRRRDLSVAWIDFSKAYDMTPHSWIRACLKTIKAPKLVRKTLAKLILKWHTKLEVQGETGKLRIPVVFRRGLYQFPRSFFV